MGVNQAHSPLQILLFQCHFTDLIRLDFFLHKFLLSFKLIKTMKSRHVAYHMENIVKMGSKHLN